MQKDRWGGKLSMLDQLMNIITDKRIYPEIKLIQGVSTEPDVEIDGRKVSLFCSSNYLGLATHTLVKEAAKRAVDIYGLGSCGSGLVSGSLDIHTLLEEGIANFLEEDNALSFATGTLANMGVISAVMNPSLTALVPGMLTDSGSRAIFFDQYAHGSIIDALKMAKPDRSYVFAHNDMDDLERKLKRSKERYRLIVTDGLFSMEGDTAPLAIITDLAERYGAVVMVDDAHGVGVLGANGRGACELHGVENQVDIRMGTFSKAFGASGGYIAGSSKFIKYLRVGARTYVFTATLPAAIVAAIIVSMGLAKKEAWRRKTLLANAQAVRDGLNAMGLNTLRSEAHIIPVFVGDEDVAQTIAAELFSMGIFSPCIRFPAVPKRQARIRISMMATHTEEHIQKLLISFRAIAEKYKLPTAA